MGFGDGTSELKKEGTSQGCGVYLGILLNGSVYTNHKPR